MLLEGKNAIVYGGGGAIGGAIAALSPGKVRRFTWPVALSPTLRRWRRTSARQAVGPRQLRSTRMMQQLSRPTWPPWRSLACASIECFTRSLAGEVGKYGVRVVSLRPNFTPETSPEPVDLESDDLQALITGTALGRLPRLAEVATTQER